MPRRIIKPSGAYKNPFGTKIEGFGSKQYAKSVGLKEPKRVEVSLKKFRRLK